MIVDFGRTAHDYATHRSGFPDERILAHNPGWQFAGGSRINPRWAYDADPASFATDFPRQPLGVLHRAWALGARAPATDA